MHEAGQIGEIAVVSAVHVPEYSPAVKLEFTCDAGVYVAYLPVASAHALALDLLKATAAAHADCWVAHFARDRVEMGESGVEAAVCSFRDYRRAFDERSDNGRGGDEDRAEADGPDPFVPADAERTDQAAP